ncbi:MAG: hypothetical protein ACI8ZX_000880 [Planctomycetota bacterium]|jgi:hypothetical protein
MKKYILPILTAAVLGLTSCNEEAATATEAVEINATELKNNPAEKVENIQKEVIQNTTAAVTETTTMSVDRMVHDFGTIADDKQVTTKFTITNTGDKPLIITQAKGSCGCTVPEYPKTPIAPGETGEIDVTFNPKGKEGAQNKTVTLIANTTPANTVMNIKSVVNKVAQ